MNKTDQERREHPRVPMMVRVTDAQTGETHQYFSREISRSGLFLETKEMYSTHQDLELQFQIPGTDQEIFTKGVVVRQVQKEDEGAVPGIGIRFVGLEKPQEDWIGEYVDKLEYIRRQLSE